MDAKGDSGVGGLSYPLWSSWARWSGGEGVGLTPESHMAPVGAIEGCRATEELPITLGLTVNFFVHPGWKYLRSLLL